MNCSAKSEIVPTKKDPSSGWGVLKDYAENWGNHYALPKPKTPEEKQKGEGTAGPAGLPAFRYHHDPLETGAFEESPDGVACDCCGRMTAHFLYRPLLLSGGC